MPNATAARDALDQGVAYIASQQLSSGAFESFSSPTAAPFVPQLTYRTTFAPALILSSLSVVPGTAPRAVRQRLAAWLARQASANGGFNYWAKGTAERRRQPYPDDWDDTACALSALWLHDQSLVDERALAKVVKLLVATESAVGGPYRTWLVPPAADAAWLDIDLAVNSNVAYFLSLVSNPLPSLTKLIDQAIVKGQLVSPYYPSTYPLTYYIARGYRGRQKTVLIKLVRQLVSSAGTALELALSLAALGYLGATDRQSRAATKLLSQQTADGSWPAAAFCLDPEMDGQPYYNGAAALTTAFALEALQLCDQTKAQQSATAPPRRAAAPEPVLALAKRQCRSLQTDLRRTTERSLTKLAGSSNGREIIDLPVRFNQSLRQPVQVMPRGFLENLSLANLYGWLAYTIYDDFLDDEGQPNLLPSANVAMRNSLSCFSEALPSDQAFTDIVRQIFNTIDGANAWEQAHCRFEQHDGQLTVGKLPDYGDLSKLAERSLGHGLAPLAVLVATGLNNKDSAFQYTHQAISHYLIARQLNDDAHDWPEDLSNGHITYVVSLLLKDLHIKPGAHDLSELLPRARRHFWHATLPKVCREMRRQVGLSRRAIRQAKLFKPDSVIATLLDGIEASIEDTLDKQSQAQNFLKQYRQQVPRP